MLKACRNQTKYLSLGITKNTRLMKIEQLSDSGAGYAMMAYVILDQLHRRDDVDVDRFIRTLKMLTIELNGIQSQRNK